VFRDIGMRSPPIKHERIDLRGDHVRGGSGLPGAQRSEEVAVLPLCDGRRGEVVELARVINASASLTQLVVNRRQHVIEGSWINRSTP
jgi:hypothetical protein